MALALAGSTTSDRRKFRFCLRVLVVRMWRKLALRRFSLPVPVILKRLAAPRFVFCLGMSAPFRFCLVGLAAYCSRQVLLPGTASAFKLSMKAASEPGPPVSPDRLRGETVRLAASLSPTTSMYG